MTWRDLTSAERLDINSSTCLSRSLTRWIAALIVSDLSESEEVLSGFLSKTTIESVDISNWRFSYWVERNLLKRLKHKKKSQPEKQCFKALEDYYFEVNSGILFTQSIVQKVYELYRAFQKFPRLSAKCGNEPIGESFHDDYDALPERLYVDTYYECNYNDIQISTFIEHRARLAIFKNAIDYKLYKDSGIEGEDI